MLDPIWWGVVIGMIMIAILGRILREFVMAAPRGDPSRVADHRRLCTLMKAVAMNTSLAPENTCGTDEEEAQDGPV